MQIAESRPSVPPEILLPTQEKYGILEAELGKEGLFLTKIHSFFHSPRSILPLAVSATFLWGLAYPAVKLGYGAFGVAADDVPSLFLFAGTRFLLAGLVTLALTWGINGCFPVPAPKALPAIGSLALLQTFGQYAFYYVGLANTTGVRASILNAASSFLTVLLSGLIWRRQDQVTGQKLLGCLLGLGGVALVNLGGSLGSGGFTLTGEGFILIASAMMALGAIASKATTRGLDPMLVTGWQLTLGGTGLLAVGQCRGGQLSLPTAAGVWLMALMVLISAVAFTLWTTLLKYHPVSKVAVFNFLTPVFGALLSGLVLSERLLSPFTLLALALVAAGILLVNRPQRDQTSPV